MFRVDQIISGGKAIRPSPLNMMSLRESHREGSWALCSFAFTAIILVYRGRTTAYLGSQCWLHLLTMCVSHTGPAVSTTASRTLLKGFLNGQGAGIPASIAANRPTFATLRLRVTPLDVYIGKDPVTQQSTSEWLDRRLTFANHVNARTRIRASVAKHYWLLCSRGKLPHSNKVTSTNLEVRVTNLGLGLL